MENEVFFDLENIPISPSGFLRKPHGKISDYFYKWLLIYVA
jgi:hypothetical protein